MRYYLITFICLNVNIVYIMHVSNFQRKLDGYNFSVYTTTICPRNETEWTERSSALNCNKSNGYMCLPNENFDELLEFCYIVPFERIQEGKPLFLKLKVSAICNFSVAMCERNIPVYLYPRYQCS